MNRIILIALSFCMASITFSQIELGGDPPTAKEKKEEKKKKMEAKEFSSTSVYYEANWSYTTRNLSENEGLFADPLGERANETSLNTWSFSLGFRNQLNRFLSWSGGISFVRNGESYLYEQPDTMFTYDTKYKYIGMPIKLYFNYGEDFKLLAGAGLMPQMFLQYRQDSEWRTMTNATDSESFKTRSGYSTFVVSALFSIGGEIKFSPRWSLYVMPEYRLQITDSYLVTDSYDHFARALGVNMGLTMKL